MVNRFPWEETDAWKTFIVFSLIGAVAIAVKSLNFSNDLPLVLVERPPQKCLEILAKEESRANLIRHSDFF